MAQKYLPEVRQGDKRILLVDGEPLCAVLRVPAPDDARGNLHVGARPMATTLEDRDLSIVRKVGPWLRERPDAYGDDVRSLLEIGEMLLATHYIQAQRYRRLLRREFLDAFKSVDVFICPSLPFTATRVRETTVVIEHGVAEDMLSAIMQFTGVPSLTGLPSLNVPCGFDADGLPIGMQIIGQPFDEATLFRVGAAFQSVTDFHTRGPAL